MFWAWRTGCQAGLSGVITFTFGTMKDHPWAHEIFFASFALLSSFSTMEACWGWLSLQCWTNQTNFGPFLSHTAWAPAVNQTCGKFRLRTWITSTNDCKRMSTNVSMADSRESWTLISGRLDVYVERNTGLCRGKLGYVAYTYTGNLTSLPLYALPLVSLIDFAGRLTWECDPSISDEDQYELHSRALQKTAVSSSTAQT